MITTCLHLLLLSVSLFDTMAGKNDLATEHIKGAVKKRVEYLYEPLRPISEEVEKAHLQFKYVYVYNKQGNLLEESSYTGKGELLDSTAYTYDNKGKLTGVKMYNGSGKLMNIATFTFDQKGNKTQLIQRMLDSTVVLKETRKYDNAGILVEKEVDNPYYYYKRYKYTWKWDTNGDCLEKKWIKYKGANTYVDTYTYKYLSHDKTGNWTKRIEYHDGVTVAVSETEIEYYR